MHQFTAILASDGLCRDGTRVHPGALASALHQRWDEGTPFHVSHDLHRPIGWMLPAAVYFEPGLTRLCGGTMIAESAEEWRWVMARARAYWDRRNRERASDFAELYRQLGEHATPDAKETIAECVAVYDPGIAQRACPHLFAQRDKDGLIPISALTPIAPGVYSSGAMVVFAHAFFRRSLSPMNTLNFEFLAILQSLDPSVRPRVALDPDMVGLASTYSTSIEHLYWRGPLFSEDLAGIDPGLTVYGAGDRERFFTGISRTEFWWYSRKAEHILEVEELRDERTFAMRGPDYGCRYAHSIISEKTGETVHFDGAVRLYDEEQLLARLDMQLQNVERDKPYQKLWRIDGPVQVLTWKRLLSAYYRDNPLVGEYLGGKEALYVADPDDSEGEGDQTAADLPYLLSLTGPRVMISFRPRPPDDAERKVIPLKALGFADGPVSVVEFPTVELVKRLRQAGHQIDFDAESELLVSQDPGFNLPLLWHRSSEHVPATIETVRVMCRTRLARGESGQVSLTLGLPLGTAGLIISIMATSSDLLHFLDRWGDVQPHLQDMNALAEAISRKLHDWPTTSDPAPELGLAISRGSLEVPRLEISPDRLELLDGDAGVGLGISSENEPGLLDRLERGELMLRLGGVVRVATCTTCGDPYVMCPCAIPAAGPPARVTELKSMTAHVSEVTQAGEPANR